MTDTDLSDARLSGKWTDDGLKELLESVVREHDVKNGIAGEEWRYGGQKPIAAEVAIIALRRVASRPQQGEDNAELVKELLEHANEQAALIHVIEGWRDATKRHHKKTEELCRRAASALSRAGNGIPDGWRLVPKEPTEAMLKAANAAFIKWASEPKGTDKHGPIWKAIEAMLDAALQPAPTSR